MPNEEVKEYKETEINEKVDIKDSNTDVNESQEIDPMKLNLDDLKAEELMSLYDIATKIKNDSSYNPIPDIPKKVYESIRENAKQLNLGTKGTNILAREMIVAFAEEIAINEDIKTINKEIDHIRKLPEFMDIYGEALRETYDDNILKEVDLIDDPERKKVLLSIREAFIDSYSLTSLYEIINCKDDELSKNKIIRTMRKRIDKYCDDFDYTLNKNIVKKTSIRSLVPSLKIIYPDMEDWRRELFILCLAMKCYNANKDDKGMSMYMYASLFNINTLAINIKNKVEDDNDFIKTRKKNLDKFFDYTRDTFPSTVFPELKIDHKNKKQA